jgi:hypothetical protein
MIAVRDQSVADRENRLPGLSCSSPVLFFPLFFPAPNATAAVVGIKPIITLCAIRSIFSICNALCQEGLLTLPDVPPSVCYPSGRHWQRWGPKPQTS